MTIKSTVIYRQCAALYPLVGSANGYMRGRSW